MDHLTFPGEFVFVDEGEVHVDEAWRHSGEAGGRSVLNVPTQLPKACRRSLAMAS